MKKIEMIWREILYQILEKKNNRFIQKDLAARFSFSTSTVFQALLPLRQMGAVRVSGRDFRLEDPEKLLYYWASFRDFSREIIYQTRVSLPMNEIEGRMLPEAVFGGFSAYRFRYSDTPADYDRVVVYLKDKQSLLEEAKQRYPGQKGTTNLLILKADPFLSIYGQLTTIAQTFVDLWNLPEWYAKEYVKALKEKIDAALS